MPDWLQLLIAAGITTLVMEVIHLLVNNIIREEQDV